MTKAPPTRISSPKLQATTGSLPPGLVGPVPAVVPYLRNLDRSDTMSPHSGHLLQKPPGWP
jgi:hypothetical protein